MKRKNIGDARPPSSLPEVIEFIVERSPGYKDSEPYQIDLDGDYKANLDFKFMEWTYR